MANNNKKKNNTKKNNKSTEKNKTVNILIISITVLVIALAALIAVSFNNQKNNKSQEPEPPKATEQPKLEENETSDSAMVEKIAALGITENPIATLEMENGGIIEIELYPDIAPNTVCNFIELANNGYYDGLIFHRCIPGFMIQGGCPEGTGSGGPGYKIKGEFSSNGFQNDLKHERGVISTARQGENPYTGEMNYDTAGSQFFIMVEDYPYLDGDYASFGKVISGMEVADAIVANETDEYNKPLVEQVIKSIRVDTKGITYPESEKIR